MFGIGRPTLAIRQFNINEAASDAPAIEIEGRAVGFVSWLLTLMKLSTLTTLRLEADRLVFVESSLSGEIHTVVPLAGIDSTQCGYSKTIWLLGVAVAVLLVGLSTGDGGPILVSILIAAAFGAAYFFSDKMFISISAGSTKVALEYKKGVIEGTTIDLERSLQAIAVINGKVMEQRST